MVDTAEYNLDCEEAIYKRYWRVDPDVARSLNFACPLIAWMRGLSPWNGLTCEFAVDYPDLINRDLVCIFGGEPDNVTTCEVCWWRLFQDMEEERAQGPHIPLVEEIEPEDWQ